jgi:hypothetical protein
VPIDAKRLKDSAAEFDGQIGVLADVQIVGESERGGDIVAFKVKTADDSVTFPVEAFGTGEEPVFVMSAAWARTLELDNGPKRDTTCSLRIRMERIGKTPVARILGITYPAVEGEAEEELADPAPFPLSAGGGGGEFAFGGAGEMGGATLSGAEFRLFRFIDTTVKPGQRYRYRVRLSVRNPNFGIDRQHLADPASAKGELLPSKESNETPPVSVPDATTLLVQTLTKEEIKEKKLKPGALQVLWQQHLGRGAPGDGLACQQQGAREVRPHLRQVTHRAISGFDQALRHNGQIAKQHQVAVAQAQDFTVPQNVDV